MRKAHCRSELWTRSFQHPTATCLAVVSTSKRLLSSSSVVCPEDIEARFSAVCRPTLHFSKYVSPNWDEACRLVERVWWEVRKQQLNRRNATSGTTGVVGLTASEANRQRTAVLGLLVDRCYFPPCAIPQHARMHRGAPSEEPLPVTSCAPCLAWHSSLLLFHAAVMHKSIEHRILDHSSSDSMPAPPDTSRRRRVYAEVLTQFYSDTAVAHLFRNATMAHGALWQEVLELYGAIRHREGGGLSVADNPHFPLDGDTESHFPRFQAVERPIRLMTLTTLLDGGQWMQGIAFYEHMLRHRDYPNHIVTGYLFKRLSEAGGRWHETLQLLHVATQLLARGKVAHQGGVGNTRNVGRQWTPTLCTGLASVCRFVKQGLIPRAVFDASLEQAQEACHAFRPDGALSFAMAQLPGPRARTDRHDSGAPTGTTSRTELASTSAVGDVFAAIRGAALDRNWTFALQLLCDHRIISAGRRNVPSTDRGIHPIDVHDSDAVDKGVTIRQFILGAAAPSTRQALDIRRRLDDLLPMPTLDMQAALEAHDAPTLRLLKEMGHEKEIVLSKLGARHSALLGCWEEALDVLMWPAASNGTTTAFRNAGGTAHGLSADLDQALLRTTTPRSVSFFLRTAMPWAVALMALKYFRPVLVLGETSTASARQEVEGDANSPPASFVPPTPYTSAMLNVCETLLRQNAQPDALHSMLSTLMGKYRTSPTSFLLACTPSDTMLPLLRAHGEVVDHGVLHRVITAPDRSADRIATWEGCLTVLTACLRRQVRRVPERSSTSIFRVLSTACVLAALQRLHGVGPSLVGRSTQATDRFSAADRYDGHGGTQRLPTTMRHDAAAPGTQWTFALQLWKWVVNSQPRCMQKANHDAQQHVCTQHAASLAVRTASVVLDAADCAGDSTVASYAAQVLWDVLVRHKLRPPLHAFSPSVLDEILPASLFSQRSAFGDGSTASAEARLQCIGVLVESMVGRCHAGRFATADRAEALYQAVKYASRGARYASSIAAGTNGRGGTTSASHGDGCTAGLGVTLGGEDAPLWCLALAAAGSAERLVGLGQCRPQLFAHALDAIPSSVPVQTRVRLIDAVLRCYGGVEALMLLEPRGDGNTTPEALLSERAVRLLLHKGDWQQMLRLAARYQPAATVETLQRIAPEAALDVLHMLEQ